MNKEYLFTSESVTEGHPDKMCDQISDAILDSIIEKDPMARVACETAVTTGLVVIMGEISTSCYVDISKIARDVVRDIGYDRAKFGFDADTCSVITSIDEQSADIAMGVDKALEVKDGTDSDTQSTGAGDQGMMFGYACDETPELMPMPISLAHALAKQLTKVRKENVLGYLRPDGKTQVTIKYIDGVPSSIDTIVISSQHAPEVSQKHIREDIIKHVINPIVDPSLMDDQTKIYINPTGRFVIGGPNGDTGLTGRKIIVDTYGGYAKHGGGAFSGKDPTKVDRSGAYAARWVAKNIVKANLAKKCEIEIAYAIGIAKPVSVTIDTFGTATVDEDVLEKAVLKVFDLRPVSIIKSLDLRRPIYRNVAAYGHMGREDIDAPWERTNMVEQLKNAVSKSQK